MYCYLAVCLQTPPDAGQHSAPVTAQLLSDIAVSVSRALSCPVTLFLLWQRFALQRAGSVNGTTAYKRGEAKPHFGRLGSDCTGRFGFTQCVGEEQQELQEPLWVT